MTTKLNSFTLPDNVINKMKDKLKLSTSLRVEVGFILCSEKPDNILHDELHCTGGTCSIYIPSKPCKKGKRVGGFHVHPNDDSDPSIADISSAYDYGMECIGNTKDNDIKCYIRKDKNYDYNTHKNIETIRTLCEEGDSSKKDIENYLQITDSLKRTLLNTVTIR